MKKIIGIVITLACLQSIRAQYSEFAYQVSFPTGDFKNFINKTSFIGFSGQWRKALANPQLSVGGSLSWFYFQEKKGNVTEENKMGTITANVNHYTNIYSLFAILQYDFTGSQKTVPFIRGGPGIAYQNQKTDAGLYTLENDGVQFGVNAEIGVRVNPMADRGLVLAGTYHYFPASGDLVSTSFFGIKIGVSMGTVASKRRQ